MSRGVEARELCGSLVAHKRDPWLLLHRCPEDEQKKDPGVCGCHVDETDIDLDGVLDCIDG